MTNGDDRKSKNLADCAKKRLISAKQLENIDRTGATYIAGIACETMFRSLRYKNKREHNSGHCISDLAQECGYFVNIPEQNTPCDRSNGNRCTGQLETASLKTQSTHI